MSIKQALLALLDQGPKYGYQLRLEFEQQTGATWPLNVGQVYTTLNRLERDSLVEGTGVDDEGHVIYRVTAEGRDEVSAWFAAPVSRSQPSRDELVIKVALAIAHPDIDALAVIGEQRVEAMRALQDLTQLKRSAGAPQAAEPADLAWSLVLESMTFNAESEIRWLDHCESRLLRAADGPLSIPARPRNDSPLPQPDHSKDPS
jgi:DNA-binding PadR family transcriptional regulator